MSSEIIIKVEKLGDDKGAVDISVPDDVGFGELMMAAEYLLHITARKSGAGYEKAMELILQGAMTYRDAG